MPEQRKDDGGGLRGSKRRRTAAGIVANAIRLFREKGVRGASLSDVARASDVSTATLFNYFPKKGALAEAWVRGEIDEATRALADDLAEHGLRPAMRRLCRRLASRDPAETAVRLEAWGETGRALDPARTHRHPIVRAIAAEQERERVRGDVSAEMLAEMLMDGVEGGMIDGLRRAASESESARLIQARVDLVLDGARKKNERVAAPTPSSRSRPRGPSR